MKTSSYDKEIKINHSSVFNYIENNYPHLGKLQKIKTINSGPNTSVYYLLTDKGDFTLRKFNENFSTRKIEKIGEILIFCHKKDIKVMEPVYNSNKKFVDPINRIYLTKFYPGNFYSGEISQLKNLSKNLALLHKILDKKIIKNNFKFRQENIEILTDREIYEIQKKINLKENEFDKKVSKNFALLLEFIIEDKNKIKIIKKIKLKKQLIHHDLHEKNLIFNKNKVLAIIDFFSMRNGYLLEDIAFCCYRLSIYQNKDIKKIQKMIKIFVNEYNLVNKIDKRCILYLDFFFKHELLKRLSKILRDYYFHQDDKWISDFQKHIVFLKTANLVGNPLIKK